jgi:hypothetical protein
MPKSKAQRDKEREKALGKGEARRAASKIRSRGDRIAAELERILGKQRDAQSTDRSN